MKRFGSSVLSLLLVVITAVLLVACTNKDSKEVKAAHEKLEIGFTVEGDKLDAVTGDVTLPAKDGEVVITWESSKAAVVSVTGKVVRGDNDEEVTLTATLTKGKANDKKEFKVKVLKKEVVDNTLAEAAKVALVAHFADTLGNPNWKATDDVTLVTTINELPVVWTVLAGEDNFTTTGKVTRPAFSKGDASIQLRARIDDKVNHTFYFLVEKLEETTEEKIQSKLDLVTIVESSASGYQETSFATIKKVIIDGTEVNVKWESSDLTGMEHDGTLAIFQGDDKFVTLTATITYDGITLSKAIEFKLRGTQAYDSFEEVLTIDLMDKKVFVRNVTLYAEISGGYYLATTDGKLAYVHGKRDAKVVPEGKVFDIVASLDQYYGVYQLKDVSVLKPRDGEMNVPVNQELTFAQIAEFKEPNHPTSMIVPIPFTMKNVKIYVNPDLTGDDTRYNTFIVPTTFDPAKDTPNKSNSVMIYYQSEIDALRALDGVLVSEIKAVMYSYRSDKLVWYANFFDFEGDVEVSLTPEQEVAGAEAIAKGKVKDNYYFNDEIDFVTETDTATLVWKSLNEDIIGSDGKVVIPDEMTEVILQVEITSKSDNTVKNTIEIKTNVGDLEVSPIQDLIKGKDGAAFRIEGVVTSFGPYNSFTVEDASGAVAFRINGLNAASKELTFKVGDKVSAIVTRKVFNGLVQGELFGGKDAISKVTVTEGTTLPAALDLNTEALTAKNLTKFQSKLVNLNNMLVVKHEVDKFNNVIMTLLRQDGQEIEFKWDARVLVKDNTLATLKVNDVVNIVGAPLSWNNGPVIMYENIAQVVKVETLTDEIKLAFDSVLFNPAIMYPAVGDLVLPVEGSQYKTAITYSFKNEADVNNVHVNLGTKKIVSIPESGQVIVRVIATFTLNGKTATAEFGLKVGKSNILVQSDFGKTDSSNNSYGTEYNDTVLNGELAEKPEESTKWIRKGGNYNNQSWEYIRLGAKSKASTLEEPTMYLITDFKLGNVGNINLNFIKVVAGGQVVVQKSSDKTEWTTLKTVDLVTGDNSIDFTDNTAEVHYRFLFIGGKPTSSNGWFGELTTITFYT